MIIAYFIILTMVKGSMEGLFNNIDSIIQEGVERLAFSRSYFLSHVADMEKIDYIFVQNYFIFLKLLTGSVLAFTATEFKKIAPHYRRFYDLKNDIEEEAKHYESYLGLMPSYYEKFDPNKQIPSPLLEVMNENLRDYLKKK